MVLMNVMLMLFLLIKCIVVNVILSIVEVEN